jgi:hypothetical protein
MRFLIVCAAATIGAASSALAADEPPEMTSEGTMTYYVYDLEDGMGIEDVPQLLIIEEEPLA